MSVPANPVAPPPRLDALTGIRGIAAWLVVLYHIRGSLQSLVPQSVIDLFAKGYLAVDLFFVLSGFVLWFNYADRLRDGGRAQTGAFLWRRFARVWPLHAFILSLFAVLAVLLVLTGRPNASYPFAQLPLHFLLIQNWGFTPDMKWNDPAWSISTEMAAYLVFPLIVLAARWDRFSSLVLIGIAVALCAAIAGVFAASGAVSLGLEIARLGIWRCLGEFCLGIIACLLWLRWRSVPGGSLWAAIACAAILAAGLFLGWPEIVFVPAVFFTAILALALDRGIIARWLATKPAVYLGEISYSTYLSHVLLFILFKLVFVDETMQLGWAGLAGYLALVALASVSLYHFVERPAQGWLNARRPGWADAPRIVLAK